MAEPTEVRCANQSRDARQDRRAIHTVTGRRRLRLAGPAIALLVAVACGRAPQTILDAELRDGTIVRDLLQPDLRTAVLVYRAQTCLACSTPLPLWEQLERQGRVRLILLLVDPVSDADRRVLTIQRIPVRGILRTLPRNVALPAEFIVSDGKVTQAALGVGRTSASALWAFPTESPPSLSVSSGDEALPRMTLLGEWR